MMPTKECNEGPCYVKENGEHTGIGCGCRCHVPGPIKDGGPVFPQFLMGEPMGGMSLRDWFAGMALSGLRSADLVENTPEREIAIACFKMADGMLKEREK